MVIGARFIRAVLASCMVRAWIKSGLRCRGYLWSAGHMCGSITDLHFPAQSPKRQ